MWHPIKFRRGTQHPYIPLVFISYLTLSIFFLLGSPPPNSVDELLPIQARYMWYVDLFMAGFLGLLGLYWHRPDTGLLIERLACIAVATGSFTYILCLFTFGKWLALAAAAPWSAACVASIWRIIQIPHLVKQIAQAKIVTVPILVVEDPEK